MLGQDNPALNFNDIFSELMTVNFWFLVIHDLYWTGYLVKHEISTKFAMIIARLLLYILLLLGRPHRPYIMLIIEWWYSIPEHQLQGH